MLFKLTKPIFTIFKVNRGILTEIGKGKIENPDFNVYISIFIQVHRYEKIWCHSTEMHRMLVFYSIRNYHGGTVI